MLVSPKLYTHPPEKIAEWDAYMKKEIGIDNYTALTAPQEVRPGIFNVLGFNFDVSIEGQLSREQMYPPLWEYYHKGEEFSEDTCLNAYGVCDNVEQILARCPELETDPNRKYVISLSEVRKEDEEPDDGWRWEKWGPYIGTQNRHSDYLYYEPEIESILVYHIYELTKPGVAA